VSSSAAPVPQEPRPEVRIGRVDADVQGAEALGHDALQVRFGEPREGREVAVQERQAVVVVLHREARSHARRQLVDEAERAVVVAGPHAVEDRAREPEPEGLTRRLAHDDVALEPAPADLELDARLVRQELVADDVAHRLAVDAQQLVAGEQPGGRRR
jgi:riboflavin biosynthesis pyrimidine reductase